MKGATLIQDYTALQSSLAILSEDYSLDYLQEILNIYYRVSSLVEQSIKEQSLLTRTYEIPSPKMKYIEKETHNIEFKDGTQLTFKYFGRPYTKYQLMVKFSGFNESSLNNQVFVIKDQAQYIESFNTITNLP
jgi:hypothetical protein